MIKITSNQIKDKRRFHFTPIRSVWQYQILLGMWENGKFLALLVRLKRLKIGRNTRTRVLDNTLMNLVKLNMRIPIMKLFVLYSIFWYTFLSKDIQISSS